MSKSASGGWVPTIFSTGPGCQCTSKAWLEAVERSGTQVGMDGKGRWMDNVFIERLWRSVKYEDIYLREYSSIRAG